MSNIFILHGCCDKEEYYSQQYPSPSNFHWIPWLQKQFLMKGYNCQTPEFPTPYMPKYREWKNIFDLYPVDSEATLIAYSCGCGFLLRWLGENKKPIKRLVLVAPWLDPEKKLGSFLDFVLNPDLADRIGTLSIFYSHDEPVFGVKDSVEVISKMYPKANMHTFGDKGHFCYGEMGTDEFPELLTVMG